MAGETDGSDNGPGATTREASGQVVQLPRDWFGPRDELVPIGPRARDGAPAREGTHPATGHQWATGKPGPHATPSSHEPTAHASPGRPLAVDFWGGLATVDELVPFPDSPSGLRSAENGQAPAGPPRASRPGTGPVLRSIGRRFGSVAIRRRRVTAGALAVVLCGVIAARALLPQPAGGLTGAGTQKIAQRGRSLRTAPAFPTAGWLDGRDEPSRLGVRLLTGHERARAASRKHRIPPKRRVGPSRRPAGPSASSNLPTAQPVVYSPQATTQPATGSFSSSISGEVSSAGGSGDGGGSGSRSNGGRSPKPGPTGPGAPFGPGTLGK
jgi:hypothetical protein